MQLEGHGSYWKAKIFKIQEFKSLWLLLKWKVCWDLETVDPGQNVDRVGGKDGQETHVEVVEETQLERSTE